MIPIAGIAGGSLVSGTIMVLCLFDAIGGERRSEEMGPSLMSVFLFSILSILAVYATVSIPLMASNIVGLMLMVICVVLFYWTPAILFVHILVENGTSP